MEFLKNQFPETEIRDFMLFENKGKKDLETYRKVQSEVKERIKNYKNANDEKKDISIIRGEDGKMYAVHTRFHYIGELQSLIGEKEYQKFLNPAIASESRTESNEKTELSKAVNEMLFELMKNSGASKDPAENQLKKRRKKRR